MISNELRKKFLDFFKDRARLPDGQGHKIVPSSSLIPDDPSVLLTTAGMQQFKKYYTGEADAMRDFGSQNTTSIQKCFRTSDIDEVGDESHLTFFEMLGNFSFGGYFKEEAIEYAYEFIQKELGLKIDYVTVFSGGAVIRTSDAVPVEPDQESENIWRKIDPKIRIELRGKKDNFWGPTGAEGPCGPTTEIYVNGTEIWNIVFNQYYHQPNGILEPLKTFGVDTGMGLERLAMISQGKKNIFETDLFEQYFKILPKELPERTKRIVIDHLRGAAFLLADGVRPSNKEAGYILRRLLRRAFVYEYVYKIPEHVFKTIINNITHEYGTFYPELSRETDNISEELEKERDKSTKILSGGIIVINKITTDISPEAAARLYETWGIQYEIIKEFGGERAKKLTREAFDEELKKHQEISRAGAEKKFGGHGLVLDTGELKAANEEEVKKVTRLHTATHLLQAALRKVLGESVRQAGSDITAERARFDFAFERKLTDEELKQVEEAVNFAIKQKYDVQKKEMPYEEAIKLGALHFFKEKYPPKVNVYSVGNFDADLPAGEAGPPEIFSRELCGGPHVKNTSEIGRFKIIKQEPLGSGLRRIRATVE